MLPFIILTIGLVGGAWAVSLVSEAYVAAGREDNKAQATTFHLMAGIPGVLLVVCGMVLIYGWQLLQAQMAIEKLMK